MSVVDDIISGKDVTNRNKKKKQQSTTQQNTTSKRTTQQNKTNKRSVTDTVVSPRIKTTKQSSEEEKARQEAERYVKNLTDSWKERQSKTFNLGKLGKDAINFSGKAINAPIKLGTNLGKGAAKTGQNILNGYIDYVASGNAEKDAKNVAKEAIKLAIDPNERKKVATKAIKSTPMALVDLSKGAMGTMENWYETLREWDYEVNDKLAHNLGIIDDEQLEKRKQQMINDKKHDFTQNLYGRWGLYDDDVQRVLKENSYLTGTNGADQLLETVGQQLPSMAIADYFGRAKGGYEALNAAKTSLKGLKGTELAKAALGNVGKSALINAPTNVEMGLRSYGSATTEALKEGATYEQSRRAGVPKTAVEIFTEYLTGGIPGIEESTGLLSNAANAIIDKTTGKIQNKYLKQIGKKLLEKGFDFVGEGSEEAISELIDPIINKYTYKQDEDIDWNEARKNAWNSFLMGGGSSLLMGGLGDAYNVYNNKQIQKQARLDNFSQQTIPTMQQIWQQRQMQQQMNQNQQMQLQSQQMFNQNIDNQVNQIEQAVMAQQITPQQGQQALAILQNQNNGVQPTVTSVQQQTPVVEQENAPTINGTTQDNINTQEQQNVAQNANNEVEQKPRNVGIHYGDLGKARDTYYWDINSSNRSTGHYGTGTYFLSEQESQRMQDSPFFSRRDRAKNEIDFNDYNLYKPLIETEARTLHDGLKAINYNNYDDFDYKSMVDDLKRHGITQEQIDNARAAVEETRERYKNEGYNDKYDAKMDSLSTVFMKALGYDGIDVRGLEGYDNTGYGSVIYDLKNKQNQNNVENNTQTQQTAPKENKNIKNIDNKPTTVNKEAYNSKPKEGTIRLYTNTSAENIDSILKNGLDVSKAKQNEYEGNMTWFETRPDLKGYGGTTIAVDVPSNLSMDKVNDTQYTVYDNISPENIAFIDKPVMNNYRTSDMEELLNKYGEEKVTQVFDKALENGKASISKEEFNNLISSIKQENNQQEQTNIPETKTEPVVKFDNETKKQTAKQITDTINNEIKSDEIISNIEREEGKPVRQGVRTITNATGTVQLISDMDNKVITYEPLSNEKVLNQVRGENYKKDLPTLYKECIDFIQSDKRIHAKDIAKIELTLIELQNNFNQKENVDMFTDLVQQAATLGTTDAQALQFMGVIKKLNPMAQLTSLQKAVENSIRKKDKAFEGVQIKQELVDKVLQTQKDGKVDQKAFDEAMNSLMDDIASQMKVSFADKANNLRYLSMLCSFKTHLRNITGNTLMYGLQSYKDLYAAIGESTYDAVQKLRGKEGLQERTATLNKATKEIKEFSKQKAAEIVKNQKNKYYESSQGIVGELKSRRKIWNDKNIVGKASNKLNKVNTEALNLEDKMFSKSMTQKRLANYLAANMIRTQADIDAHPEIVARAIDYATYKGKEVTYHQDSTTADTIRQARDNLYRGSGYSKALGFGIDATLPFTSTPINIAKTGLEYTPGIGTLDLNKQIKNAPKELKANVVIDSIAKQFSGLTLVGAGIFLASKGLLRGLGPGDKEDKIREDLGEKTYSLKIGNQYFDTSFLAPSTIPIFEGVELYNSMKDKDGFDANAVIDTLFGSLNPATDMSVMQSVLSMMKSVGRGGNEFQNAASQTLSNYFMQYFPTLLSQAAQAIDPYQRDTTTKKTTLGKTYDQIKYKLPFARQTLPKKVDVWGEEKKNAENPLIRAAEALFSPSNRSESKVDDTTKELFDLNKKLPDSNYSILPTKRGKTFEIEGETYQANEKDYEKLQKTYGKTAKSNLDKLIKSDSYRKANDKDKAYMVSAIYDYANYKAKEQYSKNKDIDYANSDTNRYALIDAFGVDFSKYIEQRISKIQADKDKNGNSLKNTAVKYLEAYNDMGLNDLQKQAFMNFDNKSYYIDEKAVKNKINSSDLSDKQKKLLIEKFNKNVTDNERALYKRAENIGVDYDLYTEFRNFAQNAKADKTKNGGYVRGSKKQKVIDWIDSQYLTAEQKQKLYEDYLNNQVTFTTYK